MISGRQEFFFVAIWWAGYFFPFFSHKLSITFVLHAIIFFRQALTANFFFKISSTSSWASLLFRAARASRVTWSKRRSWETPYTWYKPRTSKWRRSRWMEKVSYFLLRFLYGFKSTLQKGNAQLKKVLN